MNRPLIIPNLHVILVHFPLGLLLVGLVIELLSFMWKNHPVRSVGRWIILFAGLAMVPAALSGVYALHDIAVMGITHPPETWSEKIAVSSISADQWRELKRHLLLTSSATGLVLLGILIFLAASDEMRRKICYVSLLLVVAGAGLIGVGAWYAGEAVYKYGAAVQHAPAPAATEPTTLPTSDADGPKTIIEQINVLFPPLQSHVVMAGFALAFALVAVALSIRRITAEFVTQVEMSDADALVGSLRPVPVVHPIYAARFWLFTMVLLILTAGLGWYFLGSDSGTYNLKTLFNNVMHPDVSEGPSLTRSMLHVFLAGGLVLLPLIMAALAKWAPKQKALLGVFTVLLFAVIGVQLWIGILLLYDGTGGKLTGFN